jgi:hypothetical protein
VNHAISGTVETIMELVANSGLLKESHLRPRKDHIEQACPARKQLWPAMPCIQVSTCARLQPFLSYGAAEEAHMAWRRGVLQLVSNVARCVKTDLDSTAKGTVNQIDVWGVSSHP